MARCAGGDPAAQGTTDRYADAHDWEAYEALHAPDHVSHNDGLEPWRSSKEMIENVSRMMDDMISVHHSYDPEIIFDSPTKARGIWAMSAARPEGRRSGDLDACLRLLQRDLRKARRTLDVHDPTVAQVLRQQLGRGIFPTAAPKGSNALKTATLAAISHDVDGFILGGPYGYTFRSVTDRLQPVMASGSVWFEPLER